MEHFFTTFVRTKLVFKHRLKDLKDYDTVKVYLYELKKLGVDFGPLLFSLREKGEIWYDDDGNFKPMKKGPTDPDLLERTKKRKKVKVELTDLHLYMKEMLRGVRLDADGELPVYFQAFLDHRDKSLDSFFTVDSFSGRVHTPVVNLKADFRMSLKLFGYSIASIDVKQMQPTILAKVLLDHGVGDNPFSDAIFNGEDVYVLIQKCAGLETRPEAKKMLFRLIFGKPMDEIGEIFKGDTKWVEWINSYKSKEEPRNPHREDTHTNLAWLLQFSEVKVMTGVWALLMEADIPFLTIHDEVLCQVSDKDKVYDIMKTELAKSFKRFSLTVN